nr:MAG TPA: hypothetical protein [Caudoviricetes sp.]
MDSVTKPRIKKIRLPTQLREGRRIFYTLFSSS